MSDEHAMVFRRYKSLLQIVALAVVLLILVAFFYNNHKDKSAKLRAANIRHHELLEERNNLKREMEVLSEAKSNVEYSFKQKKLELTRVKNECKSANDELVNQGNKFRSQSLARYNALDSEYQMIKANKEDLETDYKHLKQTFERLKTEHQKIRTTYEENLKELKSKNDNIVSALERQVEHYQKELARIEDGNKLSKHEKKQSKTKERSEDAEVNVGNELPDNAGVELKHENTAEEIIRKKKQSLNRQVDENNVGAPKRKKTVKKDTNEEESVENVPKKEKEEAQIIEDNHFGADVSDKALEDYKAKGFHGKRVEKTAEDERNGEKKEEEDVNDIKQEVDVAKESLNNDNDFQADEDEENKEIDEERLLNDNDDENV